MTKFNIGDKVVPVSKTVWGGLENSVEWDKANEMKQGFLFVNSIKNGIVICYNQKVEHATGDYFNESDLIPYEVVETVSQEHNDKQKASDLIGNLKALIEEAKVVIEALELTKPSLKVEEPTAEEPTVAEPKITPTHPRQQIIDEAKEFVEKYRATRERAKSHKVGNVTAQEHYYETDFESDSVTRKTTASVFHLMFGKTRQDVKPARIGEAKCAPDDVFNKFIGEAIALGRALEINVDKFLHAVTPKEVVKGTVVYYTNCNNDSTFHNTSKGGSDTKTNNEDLNNPDSNGWSCTIVEDTKAEYKGTEQ